MNENILNRIRNMPKTNNKRFFSLWAVITPTNEKRKAAMHRRSPMAELKSLMYAVRRAPPRKAIGNP